MTFSRAAVLSSVSERDRRGARIYLLAPITCLEQPGIDVRSSGFVHIDLGELPLHLLNCDKDETSEAVVLRGGGVLRVRLAVAVEREE